jgi:phytanoyl-CoA hydroxylase
MNEVVIDKKVYRGSFGGCWPDRFDAEDVLERKLREGVVDEADYSRFHHWMRHGYVIIENAVPDSVISALNEEFDGLLREPRGDVKIAVGATNQICPMELSLIRPENSIRFLDFYVKSVNARAALFSEKIERFLKLLFEDAPLLFQSLSFEYGSQQGIHQDTAYVVVDSPMQLAASWIALEDVVEGVGELQFYDGSHRLPEYKFSGSFKHFNGERDGAQQHQEWAELLLQGSEKRALPIKKFLPKRGDALIWHADLAHGGSPIVKPGSTRRSLVGHYCPTSSNPHYYSINPSRSGKAAFENAFFSSWHYEIASSESVAL